MKHHPEKPHTQIALIHLLPNMLTIAAICAGLSAIRFGVQGHYTLAAQLVLLAAILDGLDGRLARRLGADSKMGAELDSLADFLNFGVAPPLVLYFWALQDMRGAWIAVLLYAVCCVIRLARFNVSGKSNDEKPDRSYFVGVPSPAGALLVMFPMYVSFAFTNSRLLPDAIICLHMVSVGFLMISHIPTWSFKTTRISRENVKYFLVGFAFVGAAVLTYAWTTLVAICLGYVGVVIWALFKHKKSIFNRGK